MTARYSEMSDSDFRKSVIEEFGYDPLSTAKKTGQQLSSYTDTDDLIAAFKKTGKVGKAELHALLRAIAIAKLFHMDFGEGPNAAIRFDLLDIIGWSLAGGQRAWTRKVKEEKQLAAKALYAKWQIEADKIWAKHPAWSNTRVAIDVAKLFGDNAGTIRKAIKKPAQ